jgi:hypothetical protein
VALIIKVSFGAKDEKQLEKSPKSSNIWDS